MPWLSLRQCSQPSLGLHKSISGSGRLRAQSRKEFSTFPSLSCSRTASPAGEQRLEQQCCGETASRKTQTFRPPCSPRRRHTHRPTWREKYLRDSKQGVWCPVKAASNSHNVTAAPLRAVPSGKLPHETPNPQSPYGPIRVTIRSSRWPQRWHNPCLESCTFSWQTPEQTEQNAVQQLFRGKGRGHRARTDLRTLPLFSI